MLLAYRMELLLDPYPVYADKLSRNIPIEEQIKDISLCRKSEEHAMYINAKRIYYSSIRTANSNLEKYCEIWSEYIMPGDTASSTVCHTHNSSKDYRISAPVDIWGNYHCFTWKNTPNWHKIVTRYSSSRLLLNTEQLARNEINEWLSGRRYSYRLHHNPWSNSKRTRACVYSRVQ